MLRIGICDDMPEICKMLHTQLVNGNFTTQPCEYFIFHSAEELLEDSQELDLLFLDIGLPGMSGMELMHQHQDMFAQTKVVFLTSYTHFVYEGYEVDAYRFFQKPVSDESLSEMFRALERENILDTRIDIRSEHMDIQLCLKDIIFIESYRSYIYIATQKNTWKCFMRMKDMETLLPKQFFYRIHKSIVVNVRQIKRVEYKKHRLIMSNNATLDIATRKRAGFYEFFSQSLMSEFS